MKEIFSKHRKRTSDESKDLMFRIRSIHSRVYVVLHSLDLYSVIGAQGFIFQEYLDQISPEEKPIVVFGHHLSGPYKDNSFLDDLYLTQRVVDESGKLNDYLLAAVYSGYPQSSINELSEVIETNSEPQLRGILYLGKGRHWLKYCNGDGKWVSIKHPDRDS